MRAKPACRHARTETATSDQATRLLRRPSTHPLNPTTKPSLCYLPCMHQVIMHPSQLNPPVDPQAPASQQQRMLHTHGHLLLYCMPLPQGTPQRPCLGCTIMASSPVVH